MTSTQLLAIGQQIIAALASGGGIALLFLSPVMLVGRALHTRRKKYKAAASDPFTEMPLRPAGESLRKKLEELNEKFDQEIAVTFMITIGVALYASFTVATGTSNRIALFFVGAIAVAAAISAWRSLAKLQRQLWDHRLGFDGERAVGECLNRLVSDGFEIFHDMPFDNFNIDHIIVGPPGVFAIETKTRRKPADLKGTAKATVTYDGNALRYAGGGPETDAIEQAARNAKTLSKFLSSSTGEPTQVSPILALPGWWVERKARAAVNVLNPKEIRNSFSSKNAAPLSPERIKRIAHQLTERCRISKAA